MMLSYCRSSLDASLLQIFSKNTKATPPDIITEATPVKQQGFDVKTIYFIYNLSKCLICHMKSSTLWHYTKNSEIV